MAQPTPHQDDRIPTPLPEAAAGSALRIFFGGSFDPPHLGHAQLPQHARLRLDQPGASLIYVPTARSPHKLELPTADHHRLAMLSLMLSSIPDAMIWSEELDRARSQPRGPSYWADTWASVVAMRMTGTDRFLIGTDQALSMHRWHRFEAYWRDAIVMLRNEHDNAARFIDSMQRLGVWSPVQLEHWQKQVIQAPTIDASSTAIRASLQDTSARENPIAGLDDRVHRYILEHRLYTPA